MKRITTTLIPALIVGASLFGAAACGGSGSGCGPTEEELDEQAKSKTQQVTTTCGPGTHLEGTVCVRNSQPATQSATTLGN